MRMRYQRPSLTEFYNYMGILSTIDVACRSGVLEVTAVECWTGRRSGAHQVIIAQSIQLANSSPPT